MEHNVEMIFFSYIMLLILEDVQRVWLGRNVFTQ